MDTCTDKVLEEAKGYPASLLNIIARQLRNAGILPESVAGCDFSGMGNEQMIRLELQNGQTAMLSTVLALN